MQTQLKGLIWVAVLLASTVAQAPNPPAGGNQTNPTPPAGQNNQPAPSGNNPAPAGGTPAPAGNNSNANPAPKNPPPSNPPPAPATNSTGPSNSTGPAGPPAAPGNSTRTTNSTSTPPPPPGTNSTTPAGNSTANNSTTPAAPSNSTRPGNNTTPGAPSGNNTVSGNGTVSQPLNMTRLAQNTTIGNVTIQALQNNTKLVNPLTLVNGTNSTSGNKTVPTDDVPKTLTCPSGGDNMFVSLNNTKDPQSQATVLSLLQAILASQTAPAPPPGCSNPAVTQLNQTSVRSLCVVNTPDGFIIVSDFNVTFSCGTDKSLTTTVQANALVNTNTNTIVIRDSSVNQGQVVNQPATPPPPQCRGFNKPQCSFIFTSMNTCCGDQTGIVTALPNADLVWTCSVDGISLPDARCLKVTGPNISAYNRDPVRILPNYAGYRVLYGNSTAQYNGTVTVGIDQSGSCAINIPGSCQNNGAVYYTVPQVDDIQFVVQDPKSQQYFNWVQSPDDLDVLSSTSWLVTGKNASGKGCRTEQNWKLPADFYFSFANYTSNSTFGTTFTCNSSTPAVGGTALNANSASLSASTRTL